MLVVIKGCPDGACQVICDAFCISDDNSLYAGV